MCLRAARTIGRRRTGVCAQHPHTYGTLLATGSYSDDKWPGCHSIILCVRQPNRTSCTLALHRCLLHWLAGCHSSLLVQSLDPVHYCVDARIHWQQPSAQSHCSARLCAFVSRYEVTKARPSRRIVEEVGMGLLASALLVRNLQPFCFLF